MSPTPPREMSIQQASNYLGVSERMVLNYVQSKQIAAVKVGKRWFLKKASVDAFQQRYGFQKIEIEQEKLLTKQEAQGNSLRNLNDLAVFRLLKEMQQEYLDLLSEEHLFHLLSRTIELLGAGYYSFGSRNKCHYYQQAKAALGALIARMRFQSFPTGARQLQLTDFLEQKLMPAFSALIRRFEKGNTHDQKVPTTQR